MTIKFKLVENKLGINPRHHELEVELDKDFSNFLADKISEKVANKVAEIEERKNYAEKVGVI
jgi:hypothetical protein